MIRRLLLALLLLAPCLALAQGTGPQAAPPGTPPSIAAPPPLTARGGQDAAELELQRALRGGTIAGQVSIPDEKLSVLVQPEGRDWRQFRNWTLTWAGLGLIAATLVVLAGLHLWKGRTPIEAGRSGRSLRRYNGFERVNHWMVAASFILLALSGLVIIFGAYALQPWMGAYAFAALAWWSQAVHQFIAFPFTLGLLVMLGIWLRDNLPRRVDLAWLRAGGPLAKGHPPAGRFNAGQKLLYWVTVLGGLVVAATGFVLMFPFAVTDITGQQVAHVVHGLLSMLLIAVILGHIYLGTIGTEGSLEQMTGGRADWNYLREHHPLWLEEQVVRAERHIAPPPSRTRAAGAD